ncbi:unnamed protein product [Owenia fusiformis]|uniref:Uncharacterized protein n=1 Tax=Owenia fusiformis TaxID=6347 RepID=A0A8J1Y6E2_OWEFU|nr:unnamed protein product [Owenia fusiformis]
MWKLVVILIIAASTMVGGDIFDDAGELGIDEAYLTVNVTNSKDDFRVHWQSDVCDKCSLLHLMNVTMKKNRTKIISTQFPVTLQVDAISKANNKILACNLHVTLDEGGKYTLFVYNTDDTETNFTCNFMTDGDPPPDNRIPIFIALGILTGMALIWILLKYIYNHQQIRKYLVCFETEHLINSDLGEPTSGTVNTDGNSNKQIASPPARQRLRSLDAFRGLSLVLMIFVNYRGGYYWYFRHSRWNGLTLADLVFPWFVFIMGSSMALSFRSLKRHAVPRRKIFLKVLRRTITLFIIGVILNTSKRSVTSLGLLRFTFIIGTSIALSFRSLLRRSTSRYQLAVKVTKRTLILFAIGLFLNTGDDGSQDMTTIRIPGVLQRLAFSYFGVAILECFFAQASDPHEYIWWAPVRDVLDYWAEWLIMIAVLAVQLCLTFLLPLEGDCPKGYLGPGGLHENSSYVNCTGGAASLIDRWFFGANHIYQHPTCKEVYHTHVAHDPEGILGTLTSIFMCFLGLQMGKILLTYSHWKDRVVRWLIWSVLCGAIAGGLCGFTQNNGVLPVNKNLWSLSFVLALASMAFFLFTCMYMLCDVLQWWSGAPVFYPGMNSILVYICHEVFQSFFPVSWKVPNTHASQLAMNMWGAAFWVIVSAYLYYKKIFIVI